MMQPVLSTLMGGSFFAFEAPTGCIAGELLPRIGSLRSYDIHTTCRRLLLVRAAWGRVVCCLFFALVFDGVDPADALEHDRICFNVDDAFEDDYLIATFEMDHNCWICGEIPSGPSAGIHPKVEH